MLSRKILMFFIGTLALVGVCAHAGCPGNISGGDGSGSDGGAEKPPLSGLVSLVVTPATAMLSVDNVNPPKTQQYQATGRFDDQSEKDVTAQVNWKIDNGAIGSIDRSGLFTTSNLSGGQGTLTAYSGAASATAQITVQFQPVVKSSSAPANADTLLPASGTGTVMAGNSPSIVYPSSRTMFPRNVYKVLFQWNQGTGNNLFRLEFKSQTVTMNVYTTSDRWEPTKEQWGYIANSNAGSKVTWTVYGLNMASPTTVYRSDPPVEIAFSQNPVDGAIYYWSTTVAGVRRATVSDAGPTDFLTPAQTGKCVACHTVSRNGARIAADIGGEILGVYNVKDGATVISPAAKIAQAWTTFSPDNTRIVTASKGIMTLRDGETGQMINTVPVGAGLFGTQPDWSPDGKLLVFARSTVNKDRGYAGSSIVTLEYSGGTWQNAKVLVASTSAMDTNAFPMFSPDSRWIAFTKAVGSSDKNLKARLYIVATDGSSPPVELAQADTVVSNQTLSGTAADVANNMPTWAPTRPGETMFVAFSSQRAYGKVYAFKAYNQMWVAAVDPTRLPGSDPSLPAFRLPFQGDTEDSHRPFWAEDVLATPPPPPDGGTGVMCVPRGGDCTAGPCCAGDSCNQVNDSFVCAAPAG